MADSFIKPTIPNIVAIGGIGLVALIIWINYSTNKTAAAALKDFSNPPKDPGPIAIDPVRPANSIGK